MLNPLETKYKCSIPKALRGKAFSLRDRNFSNYIQGPTTENETQDDFDDVGAYDYDLYKEDPGIETEDAEEQRLSVKEKLENAPQLLVEKR